MPRFFGSMGVKGSGAPRGRASHTCRPSRCGRIFGHTRVGDPLGSPSPLPPLDNYCSLEVTPGLLRPGQDLKSPVSLERKDTAALSVV